MFCNLKRHLARCLFVCALFSACAGEAAAQGGIRSVTVAETSFMVELADGRVLRSPELVGAVLGVDIGGRMTRLRIDAVERDAASRDNDIWLHSFSVQQPDTTWKTLCAPGPDGRTLGFPLAGRTRANGTLDTSVNTTFELACTAGTQAKCVRHGYAPWLRAPDGSSLQPAHDACVLMLRADYEGNGRPTTRDGTRIDISDRWNIRNVRVQDAAYEFEAGWDAAGAVCVHHPRIRRHVSLAQLEARTQRLRGRTGAVCTPEWARAHGALIFNWSRRQGS